MKLRTLLLALPVLGLTFASGAPVDAATTYKGKITIVQAPAWAGAGSVAGLGSDTVSARAFLSACNADRVLAAAGQKPVFVSQFIASPLNGLDAFVVDLKKETMGAFAVKGPGAKAVGPEVSGIQVTTYDMDMDFYTDPTVDPTAAKSGCANANEKATSSAHKCYAHSAKPDEKTGCISGYKDAKGKMHGARYVLVGASLNLHGPYDFTLTAP